jgi:hypothetical protein
MRWGSSPSTPAGPPLGGRPPRAVGSGRLHQRAVDKAQRVGGLEVVIASREAAMKLGPYCLQRLDPRAGKLEEVDDGTFTIFGSRRALEGTRGKRSMQRRDPVLVRAHGYGHHLLLSQPNTHTVLDRCGRP